MSADNQQERLDTKWIVGFVDGEGCFHVSINRLPKMTLGWQVLPEFRVVQHKRDVDVLQRIRATLGYGEINVNHGDRLEVRIRGLENLNKLVEFFKANPLQSSKKKNFDYFARIISLMNERKHLSREGLDEIAKLAAKMNRQPKLKYLESSETTRQTSSQEDEDIVRTLQRCKETGRNDQSASKEVVTD